jgi:hypothetical protein
MRLHVETCEMTSCHAGRLRLELAECVSDASRIYQRHLTAGLDEGIDAICGAIDRERRPAKLDQWLGDAQPATIAERGG